MIVLKIAAGILIAGMLACIGLAIVARFLNIF